MSNTFLLEPLVSLGRQKHANSGFTSPPTKLSFYRLSTQQSGEAVSHAVDNKKTHPSLLFSPVFFYLHKRRRHSLRQGVHSPFIRRETIPETKGFFLPVSPPRMCCTAHTNDRHSASAFDLAAEALARVSVSRVRSHRASNRPCCQDPLPTLFFCPSVPAPRERPPPPSRNAPFPLPP